MKISILDLRKGPQEVDTEVPAADLDLAAEGFTFPAPVSIRFRFQLLGKRVLASGHLATKVETSCVRCLCRIERDVRTETRLVFEPRPTHPTDHEAESSAAWEAESCEIDYYEEDVLDPSDTFRQLLLLELPGYPLCRSDCRGLCPQCGADLNQGSCQCETAEDVASSEPDWKARLREIKPS